MTEQKPPKCFYDTERNIVEAALGLLPAEDADTFSLMSPTKSSGAAAKPHPQYMTLDASIMEMADDIAYAVHDLEDIVARDLVNSAQIENGLKIWLPELTMVKGSDSQWSVQGFIAGLFSEWSGDRKQVISRLVNLFVSRVQIDEREIFRHPLLRLRATLPADITSFLKSLKGFTYDLVVQKANVQQLEKRGERIVRTLFDELSSAPDKLIPDSAWRDLDDKDTKERRVCDYIAGMTDSYSQRIYQRLFTPGFGSSHDEL